MFDTQGDTDRIEFLQERDTPEEVLFFARQCVKQYRGAVLASKRKHKKQGAFREAYIRSYLFHKQYVLENSMVDETLFQRGHILTRIGGDTDDFDTIVADHYFLNILDLSGEVTDSNGSEYQLVSLEGTKFDMVFTVYDNEFETDDGETHSFTELRVQCTGNVIQEFEMDILAVDTYDILSVKQ